VDNARCVGLIRAVAATWVPPSVASKDILTLFKAADLKTFVHGDFDYDVDNARCVGLIRAVAATWVPPSVASKDILTLFKAADLKTFVHGDFDYDVCYGAYI
nr:hypothetical protein [Tanacetum cinerariifolium]